MTGTPALDAQCPKTGLTAMKQPPLTSLLVCFSTAVTVTGHSCTNATDLNDAGSAPMSCLSKHDDEASFVFVPKVLAY